MIGGWELIVILFIVLILFGGKKLPELARSLGRAIAEFKKGSQELPSTEVTEEADVTIVVEKKTEKKADKNPKPQNVSDESTHS